MNILCAPCGLISLERPQKGIADLASAGFEGILLDAAMCCPPQELELLGRHQNFPQKDQEEPKRKQLVRVSEHPEELHYRFRCLVEQCGQDRLMTPIARAPYLERNTKRGDLKEVLLRLAEECIRSCGESGCGYLIVEPLSVGVERGEEWKFNREFYLALADEALKNHVVVLLQNQCHDLNGHLVRGLCSDGEEAATWIDSLNAAAGQDCFGFCMDVGACSLCGQDVQNFAVVMGSRIKAVVLRDCDGHYETSMLPFTCVNRGQPASDWLGLIRGLRETGFDGQLIMDFGTTAAAFSQFLQPQLLKFAGSVAKYFRWQISMKSILKKYSRRVLFGAGNMCRNFMKCYGQEFPPLFTCDNNKERWGQWFEGLEIKPPESLKELPSDCAIFLCNVYYREIEKQLREMEISNPVEYFNDEYMPSYYFDRLEYWEGET